MLHGHIMPMHSALGSSVVALQSHTASPFRPCNLHHTDPLIDHAMQTSNNQAMFDSTDDSSDPSLAAKPFSLGAFGCRAPAFKLAGFGIPYGSRPRSKKYKASSGGTAELSTGGGGSTSMQQALKSTAASAAASRDGLAAVVASQESTDASATGKFGDAAAAASAAGMDASGGVSALAGGHMECASSPSPGVHHTATQPTGCPGVGALARGGSSSSCGSSPAVAAVLAVEPVVQLTPSTDEARPPVSR